MENKLEERRTKQQNRALHVWYKQVADELNSEGKGMSVILKKFVLDCPATDYLIKEMLWRPLQEAMFGKHSTTELLKKHEIDQIYDALNKFFGEELHISLPPFPSLEEINLKETYGKNDKKVST